MATSAKAGRFIAAVLLAAGLGGMPAFAGGPPAAPDPLPATADEARPAAPLMIDARIVGDQKRTRFIADLTANIDVAVFMLADPYRVVVDLPELRFGLPENAGSEGRGMISEYRYGQISPGKSRIVLDVTGPVSVDKSFVVAPAENQPARLVIDMVPATRAAFLAASRAYRESQAAIETSQHDRELAAPGAATTGRPVVVLDPGHGGIDNGTRGATGVLEKEVTLAFANVLRDKLQKTGLYDVFLTRIDDSFVSLPDRVAFAQSHHASLFVSIHANSFPSEAVRGTTIYTVSEKASDKMAEDVAKSENQSDVLAGLDMSNGDSDQVKDILIDLTRRETRNFGTVFAHNLVQELKASNRMFKVPHQEAGFRVLEAPDVPSAMVELGFMSNADDEKLLLSDDWRQKTADSMAGAIAGYFKTKLARASE
jgi:N-acetylmuramoyl-L-alanine amidase